MFKRIVQWLRGRSKTEKQRVVSLKASAHRDVNNRALRDIRQIIAETPVGDESQQNHLVAE